MLDLIPFNKIPIVSDAFEAVLAMFNVGFYSSDKMSTTWLTQAVSAVDAWKDVLSGKSSTTAYNALYKSVRAVEVYLYDLRYNQSSHRTHQRSCVQSYRHLFQAD